MNAGKSTLLNALTSNAISIVDATPGTTADAKVTLMEIHGLGPCRFFDTAGLDEGGLLGEKKRQKTRKIIEQADVILKVINPQETMAAELQQRPDIQKRSYDSLCEEALWNSLCDLKIDEEAATFKKPVLEIVNDQTLPDGTIKFISARKLVTNAQKVDPHELARIISQIKPNLKLKTQFLPNQLENSSHKTVLLIIPLDAQSPKLRLLRPQQQAIEALLSKKHTVIAYQLDLNAARGKLTPQLRSEELTRLNNFVNDGIDLVITDSQAMDIVRNLKAEKTTFSVMQMHHLLGQELFEYTNDSIALLDKMVREKKQEKLKILIAEACHHDRITANCDDIGTRQIPNYLKQLFGDNFETIHAFGKDDTQMDVAPDLVIHCGGCMISSQQMRARISGFMKKRIPIVSYGSFISFATGGMGAVDEVLKVWK